MYARIEFEKETMAKSVRKSRRTPRGKKRGTHKRSKKTVRSHDNGGVASPDYMYTMPHRGSFRGSFQMALGQSLGQLGAMKAIDTMANIIRKKKKPPKPKPPMLVSYDSGYYTYR